MAPDLNSVPPSPRLTTSRPSSRSLGLRSGAGTPERRASTINTTTFASNLANASMSTSEPDATSTTDTAAHTDTHSSTQQTNRSPSLSATVPTRSYSTSTSTSTSTSRHPELRVSPLTSTLQVSPVNTIRPSFPSRPSQQFHLDHHHRNHNQDQQQQHHQNQHLHNHHHQHHQSFIAHSPTNGTGMPHATYGGAVGNGWGSSHNGSMNEGLSLPVRHPRPMTAAEVHLELEKEQEAVVNRLTRELSALRAQSASVASNASSTSTSTGILTDNANLSDTSGGLSSSNTFAGPTHPISSRRHRSSSSVSWGSMTNNASAAGGAGAGAILPHRTASVSSAASNSNNNNNNNNRNNNSNVNEIESLRSENEALRRKVRELEGLLAGRRRGRRGPGGGNAAGPGTRTAGE